MSAAFALTIGRGVPQISSSSKMANDLADM
jgi:hypothetical protein